jgi:hypothetical protein
MAIGKKTGGKRKGSKNKATLEREAKARAELAAAISAESKAAADRLVATGMVTPQAAQEIVDRTPQKLMKDIAFDFARLFAGLAAFYQPYPNWTRDPTSGKLVNGNPNYDAALFKEYAVLAKDTALGAASYESPKLSAVMVGQQIVNEVVVTGGMPDEFSAPINAPAQFQPGDIVSAEDGVEDRKVIAGEIVPMPSKAAG